MKKQKIFRRRLQGMIRLVLLMIGTLSIFMAGAQSINVTGQVKDETGRPVEGVSVMVKGKATGTQTNAQGSFALSVDPGSMLVFTSVGFAKAELPASADMQVTLKVSSGVGDEVIVVGYGTQRKVNNTGSVSSVSSKLIENRPVTNPSNALTGLAPGVYVRQTTGQPGRDGANIRIRGLGTLNNNNPFVLIDGIQGTLDAVNPLDIENISILKDAASAAIYGAQAANGVILVTTKKGSRSRSNVTYTGMFSMATPMNKMNMVNDYATYMRLINEAGANLGQPPLFSNTLITDWENAKSNPDAIGANGYPNSVLYPNTDWFDVVMQSRLQQIHNVGINGGSEKVMYQLSVNFLDNPGLMENSGIQRYQVRTNLDAKINKFMTVGTQTFASQERGQLGNVQQMFDFLWASVSGQAPYYDGKYGGANDPVVTNTNNPLFVLNQTGGKSVTSRFNSTVYLNLNLAKGLVMENRFNYQTNMVERNSFSRPFDRWNFISNQAFTQANTVDQLGVNYSYAKDYRIITDVILKYNTKIKEDHDFGALAGFNQNYFNYYDFRTGKQGLTDPSLTTLSSANLILSSEGTETDNAIQSFFGRVNYGYKGRYLFEANLRYDGSSRFAPDVRWGAFPSFSAGWRISEEGFMRGISNTIQNLKLRASWGQLGNNQVGDYDWQSNYGSTGYAFNRVQVNALRQARLGNPALRWEKTTIADIGLEGNLFDNRVKFEIDWYDKYTDGILTVPPIFLTMGTVGAPFTNTAAVRNRGIEAMVGWNSNPGKDFRFGVSANFAYNMNMVDTYKGELEEGYVNDANGNKVWQSNIGDVSDGGNQRIIEGQPINAHYIFKLHRGSGAYFNADGTVNPKGGPVSGMIRTPEDMQWLQAMMTAGYSFLPTNRIGAAQITYGDFIYADLNEDGIYGNNFDRYFPGTNELPRFNFGLNLNASWKGFDISMIWAGSSGMQYFWNQRIYNTGNLRAGMAISERVANDRYFYNQADPNDPRNNINGTFPRLKLIDNEPQNGLASDFFMYDAAFIKLKNLQIGYTFPGSIINKIKMTNLRLFMSGENLLMFTNYPGLDPEIGANVEYPTMRQFAFGINATF